MATCETTKREEARFDVGAKLDVNAVWLRLRCRPKVNLEAL